MIYTVRKFLKYHIVSRLKKFYEFWDRLDFSDSTYRLTACDVLFFCHDVDRGVTLDGKAYSPLVDSVREDLERRGLTCLSVAHPVSILTDSHGYADPVSINRTYLIDRLARKVLPSDLRKRVLKYPNVYNEILSKTRAKLVITIGAPEELCEAARRAGSFHVELLHGIGYGVLPWGWGDKPREHLPQGVLSLDQISTRSFSPLKKLDIGIHTIPHPFLRRFVGEQKCQLPEEWILPPVNRLIYRKEILVSLSWGYAGDHGQHERLANILENGLFYKEIAQVVAESRDVLWRFRFHPVQLRKREYKYLLAYMDNFVNQHPNTEWRQSSSLPFANVAVNCSGNISMNSMACYDAAMMGLPSLMLCPNIQLGAIDEYLFEDLRQDGYVTKATISKELVSSWVNGVEKLPPRLTNLKDDAAWEEAVGWMLSSSGLDLNSMEVA